MKILIVEGDTPTAMMMVHVLSRAGCDAQVASTGKRGLELAKEIRFDLITLDIDLPDINGLEICTELKQRHLTRNTPIVFVSARATIEDQQRSQKVGAVDYIVKPFDSADFVQRILSHTEEDARHETATTKKS